MKLLNGLDTKKHFGQTLGLVKIYENSHLFRIHA